MFPSKFRHLDTIGLRIPKNTDLLTAVLNPPMTHIPIKMRHADWSKITIQPSILQKRFGAHAHNLRKICDIIGPTT